MHLDGPAVLLHVQYVINHCHLSSVSVKLRAQLRFLLWHRQLHLLLFPWERRGAWLRPDGVFSCRPRLQERHRGPFSAGGHLDHLYEARLNCSRPGEIPFNYNELQGTFFLPELELLYGIFTTNVWVKHLLIITLNFKISAVMFRVSNHRSQLMTHYFLQNLNFVVCVLSKSLLLIMRTL